MTKKKRKLTAQQRAEKKRRKALYMTIFINGKQKRVRRPPTIDGLSVDEFIRNNADPIWLHENELWHEMKQDEDDPFGNSENRSMSDSDILDLDRFVDAQESDYEQALGEIRSGRKRSHWMWYVFPQLEGLGMSSMSRLYSIKSAEEAKAYLRHPILGPRLKECVEAVLGVEGKSAFEIFGSPDDMKLRSCATLFASVSEHGSIFDRLLNKYFAGKRDEKTERLLGITRET